MFWARVVFDGAIPKLIFSLRIVAGHIIKFSVLR